MQDENEKRLNAPIGCPKCGAALGHFLTCPARGEAAQETVDLSPSPTAPSSPAVNAGASAGPLTLRDLRRANELRAPKWRRGRPPGSLEFSLMELAGECGEACNAGKKLVRFRNGWAGGADTIENLAEELADTVICADLVAMKAGIDLGAAVVGKFNATSEKYGFPDRLAVEGDAVIDPRLEEAWEKLARAGLAILSGNMRERILTNQLDALAAELDASRRKSWASRAAAKIRGTVARWVSRGKAVRA